MLPPSIAIAALYEYMYSPVQKHKKWDITGAAKKWEWSTRIREDREDKEDEEDEADKKIKRR